MFFHKLLCGISIITIWSTVSLGYDDKCHKPLTGGRSACVSYFEFIKLEPPTFSRSDASEDPQ